MRIEEAQAVQAQIERRCMDLNLEIEEAQRLGFEVTLDVKSKNNTRLMAFCDYVRPTVKISPEHLG